MQISVWNYNTVLTDLQRGITKTPTELLPPRASYAELVRQTVRQSEK